MANLKRRSALGAGALALGIFLGAPQAAGVLAPFSPVPVPNPLVVTPLVGLLLYLWTDGVQEVLGVVLLCGVVAAAVVVLTLAAPTFVLNDTAAGQGAFYQTGMFNAIAALLLALPLVVVTAVVASVLDAELGLLAQYHPRGELTAQLVAATAGLALLSALLVGSVGANYASVAEQSQIEVTVAGVDASGEAVEVFVDVPNQLRSTMRVRSIVLDLEVNGTEHVRASSLQRTTVPPGANQTFVVRVDELTSDHYRAAENVRITGVVRFRAFRTYESRVEVAPWTRPS